MRQEGAPNPIETASKEPDKKSWTFDYLRRFDVERLVNSGSEIFKKIEKDFPAKLPDAVILPDTGARPLVYLLRPLFQKLAKERGLELPQFYFFSTVKDKVFFYKIDYFEKQTGLEADSLVAELTETADAIEDGTHPELGESEKQDKEMRNFVKPTREKVSEMQKDLAARARHRQIHDDRAVEIRKYLPQNSVSIIVDDYVTESFITIQEIRRALAQNIKAYSLISSQTQEYFDQNNSNISVGFTELDGRGSFQFQHSDSVGVVKRSGKHAEVISHGRTSVNVKKLREDITKIADMLLTYPDAKVDLGQK